MGTTRFQDIVTSVDTLTDLLGSPSESGVKKQLSELDRHMETFIDASPLVLVGTTARTGAATSLPAAIFPPSAKSWIHETWPFPTGKAIVGSTACEISF